MVTPYVRGFTLVEAAFVLAIVAIVMALGAPSYNSYQQRQQLRLAAEMLTQDLQNTREMAVSASKPIFVNYRAGASWCWGISLGQPCDCAGLSPLPRCSILRRDNTDFKDVSLDATQDLEFAPRLGQVALSGGASFHTRLGQNLRVVLNPMGRTSVCGPDSRAGKACP